MNTTKYTPKHLKLWTLPPSYFGPNWEGFYSAGFGQHRDSDTLERSNFEVASKDILQASNGGAQVVSENHWAVGWVEWIAIPADDYWALKVADDLVAAANQYPVLDDDHFSELEQNEADEIWANCYSVSQRIEYIRHSSEGDFDFRNLADLLACVRGKYFAGLASELCHS